MTHPLRWLALATLAGCAERTATEAPITLHHLQLVGTHNSYHRAPPEGSAFGPGMPPLRAQLEAGIRQFELDVHYDTEIQDFRVYHLPEVDALSTCDLLSDCLAELRGWSDERPEHAPLLIFIEPKDDLDPVPIYMHFFELEQLVDEVWPRTRLIWPDYVRGAAPTLAEALRTTGWPALDAMRQRALFFLFDQGENRRRYLQNYPQLEGRLFFVPGSPSEPATALVTHDDPVAAGALLTEALQAGYLTRTRAETPEAARAAQALGVHILSSDRPAELMPGMTSRCNPVLAPAHCHGARVDQPAH